MKVTKKSIWIWMITVLFIFSVQVTGMELEEIEEDSKKNTGKYTEMVVASKIPSQQNNQLITKTLSEANHDCCNQCCYGTGFIFGRANSGYWASCDIPASAAPCIPICLTTAFSWIPAGIGSLGGLIAIGGSCAGSPKLFVDCFISTIGLTPLACQGLLELSHRCGHCVGADTYLDGYHRGQKCLETDFFGKNNEKKLFSCCANFWSIFCYCDSMDQCETRSN